MPISSNVVGGVVTLGKSKNGDDVVMPLYGVGTWTVTDETQLNEVRFLLCTAFELEAVQVIDESLARGARLIDTAIAYGNHKTIGKLLPKLLQKHNLQRDDIFIVRYALINITESFLCRLRSYHPNYKALARRAPLLRRR